MDNLAHCLRYYVAERLTNDPGWKNIVVSLIYGQMLPAHNYFFYKIKWLSLIILKFLFFFFL